MISSSSVQAALNGAILKGATTISRDIIAALERAIDIETSSSSRSGLEQTLKSLRISGDKQTPACPDTGWPLFFFKIGNDAVLEGGLLGVERAVHRAVEKATEAGTLRRTMKHPLTGYDPGNNIGENMPWLTWKFVPGRDFQVTYVAKGGGSEVFGGAQSRMVAFSDGSVGIKKFIIDSYIAASYAGAICPPSVLGIGIGGTANVAANLAKEAACLRVIGSRHPDSVFRSMEEELEAAINSLGIGTMGSGGKTSVLGVHIEYAYTHIAGIAVAMSSNCFIARRATYAISEDNTIRFLDNPYWFGGR
jgi:L(+)-tartrate dehydratase alpha subunit